MYSGPELGDLSGEEGGAKISSILGSNESFSAIHNFETDKNAAQNVQNNSLFQTLINGNTNN